MMKPSYPSIHTQTLPDGTTFDMLFVQGGEFLMGADKKSDPDAFSQEAPIHKVRVPDFYMGKHPVTQGLWQAVMGNNPSYLVELGRPVEQVSWNDAQDFIKKLNRITGNLPAGRQGYYRLPSEAEWEYAARGGTHSEGYKYAGSDKLREVGWYDQNSHEETKEVGLKYANELGMYDMSGNVYEWCEDDWHDNYKKAPADGSAWIDAPERGADRVRRGGSGYFNAQGCRAAFRYYDTPEYRSYYIGFRLVFFP